MINELTEVRGMFLNRELIDREVVMVVDVGEVHAFKLLYFKYLKIFPSV